MKVLLCSLALLSFLSPAAWSQDPTVDLLSQPARQRAGTPGSRRSLRVVPFPAIEVASPDRQVVFVLQGNPERLTFKVLLGGSVVIEPSPLVFTVDNFDLSAGVVFNAAETASVDESYPWLGAVSMARNHAQIARIKLTHDLSDTPYVLEVRAFNDGVAYRHVVDGGPTTTRVPDERSTFVLPRGSTVWFGGLEGHYETEITRHDNAEVGAGVWAGPPLTAKLPDGAGYVAITEASIGSRFSGLPVDIWQASADFCRVRARTRALAPEMQFWG